MSRSSANYIAYDLRPVKQTERRIMMDLLRMARAAGINVSDYTYIGMGGTRFYDFHMLHRYLGIRSMISIEQDAEIVERCQYNKPFGFISVANATASEFIDTHTFDHPVLAWLDYDWGLSKVITSDILTLATKVRLGSVLFVTIRADLPRDLVNKKADEKIQHFKDQLGDLALDCKSRDVGQNGYSRYVERVLTAAFNAAFIAKPNAVFRPLFRVLYKDTTWMATVGGCFCDHQTAEKLAGLAVAEFPFLFRADGGPYELVDLNFTPRERALLDHFVTCDLATDDERAVVRKLRFDDKTIAAYKSTVRFLPKYVEAFT